MTAGGKFYRPLLPLPVGTYTWLLSPHVVPSSLETTLLIVKSLPEPSVVSKTHKILDGVPVNEVQPGIPSQPIVVSPATAVAFGHVVPPLVDDRMRMSWSSPEFSEA
jgi:hypothetical protein